MSRSSTSNLPENLAFMASKRASIVSRSRPIFARIPPISPRISDLIPPNSARILT